MAVKGPRVMNSDRCLPPVAPSSCVIGRREARFPLSERDERVSAFKPEEAPNARLTRHDAPLRPQVENLSSHLSGADHPLFPCQRHVMTIGDAVGTCYCLILGQKKWPGGSRGSRCPNAQTSVTGA